MSNNDRARDQARRKGRLTFQYAVVEHWPACVKCGEPIRRTARWVTQPGLYRLCGCQGIVWRSRAVIGEGWERLHDTEVS